MTATRMGPKLAVALLALLAVGQAHAVGTEADTLISNTASADYNINGSPATTVSDTVEFRVDEIINVTVTSVGGATIVTPGDTNEIVAFDISNTGNGEETFDLTVDAVRAGDQFDPVVDAGTDIFVDANDNGTLEPGIDTLFNPNTDQLTLDRDDTVRLFVRADIPGGVVDGDQGDVLVQADTATGALAGAAAGTVADGLGTSPSGDGIDAVVGVTQGQDNDTQSYIVSAVTVTLDKSVFAISDPVTGNSGQVGSGSEGQLIPGATVTYRILVDVSGSGTAENLVITDSIAAVVGNEGTAYVQGSITIDGVGQTDANDGLDDTFVNFNDAGDIGVPGDLAPNGVDLSTDLGDVSPGGGTTSFDIRLDVEIL